MSLPIVWTDRAEIVRRMTRGDRVRLLCCGNSITEQGNFSSQVRAWACAIGGQQLWPGYYTTMDGIGAAVTKNRENASWCAFSFGHQFTSNGGTTPNGGGQAHTNRVLVASLQHYPAEYFPGDAHIWHQKGDWTADVLPVAAITINVLLRVGPDGEPNNVFQIYARERASTEFLAEGGAFDTYAAAPGYRVESATISSGAIASLENCEIGLRLVDSVATTNGAITRVAGIIIEGEHGEGLVYASMSSSGSIPSNFTDTAKYDNLCFEEAYSLLGFDTAYIDLATNSDPSFSANMTALIERFRDAVPGMKMILAGCYQTAANDGITATTLVHQVARAVGNAAFINVYEEVGPEGSHYQGILGVAWVSGRVYAAGETVTRPNGHFYYARQGTYDVRTTAPEDLISSPTPLTTDPWIDLGTVVWLDSSSPTPQDRNVMTGDGVHPNRMGHYLLGARQWGLLRAVSLTKTKKVVIHG